ncbi:hypothetical protein E3N88_23010 [Mikania micrantha]|uniref:Protein kinase domain-containing protein n=1 Tax=Mikania micrantha TaxID=192012 RepID=A0A5N6ND56_9ASTR|nr:hypothetical protein E3N88_23010 [Mikania micrantha]
MGVGYGTEVVTSRWFEHRRHGVQTSAIDRTYAMVVVHLGVRVGRLCTLICDEGSGGDRELLDWRRTGRRRRGAFGWVLPLRRMYDRTDTILPEVLFSDLRKATGCFTRDLLLGNTYSGKVFLGWVVENTLAPSKPGVGMAVAVKRLDIEIAQGAAKWQAEMNFLGHMDHPNIIRLLGYCRDELEHLLVYEYMPNKSFDRFLFAGETHVSTRVMGTYGYMAPEYLATGVLLSI